MRSQSLVFASRHTAWLKLFIAIGIMLALVSIGLFLLWADATRFSMLDAWTQTVTAIFLGIFIEALPFLLAGVVVSSIIHQFLTVEQIQRICPRSPILAAGAGALLGLLFPVCECGSIPAARQLIAKGAPVPMGIAFVLAAPVVNPIVIISTWVAFAGRPDIVLARVGLSALIAVVIGLVLGTHPHPERLMASSLPADTDHDHAPTCSHDGHHDHDAGNDQPVTFIGRAWSVLQHAITELFEMGRYLVVGGLIAAILQTAIPKAALLSIGQGPLTSVLVLMTLAVLLSICSTVDAFVALSFMGTFQFGAVLAFLVFGPMIDIKSVLMLGTTFSRRTVALITVLSFLMVLLVGVVTNIYL